MQHDPACELKVHRATQKIIIKAHQVTTYIHAAAFWVASFEAARDLGLGVKCCVTSVRLILESRRGRLQSCLKLTLLKSKKTLISSEL